MSNTLDKILLNLINTGLAFGRNPQLFNTIGGEPIKEAKQAIQALTTEARIDELKKLWNTTQHDIKPEGAADIPIDPAEILKRIAELEKQLKENK